MGPMDLHHDLTINIQIVPMPVSHCLHIFGGLEFGHAHADAVVGRAPTGKLNNLRCRRAVHNSLMG